MKRMELKIGLTFAIMFAIGVVINGIYSVTAIDSNFFTFDVLAHGLSYALVFLLFIWLSTRRHKLLAGLGVASIGIFIIFILLSSEGVTGTFRGDWNWLSTINLVYAVIAAIIASHQGAELLEEDKDTININVDVKPEDFEITKY